LRERGGQRFARKRARYSFRLPQEDAMIAVIYNVVVHG